MAAQPSILILHASGANRDGEAARGVSWPAVRRRLSISTSCVQANGA